MASSNAAFVDQYVLELRDLTFNSKPIINTLTMLASENRVAAQGIAEAVSRHIQQVKLVYGFINRVVSLFVCIADFPYLTRQERLAIMVRLFCIKTK